MLFLAMLMIITAAMVPAAILGSSTCHDYDAHRCRGHVVLIREEPPEHGTRPVGEDRR
jgi:hypothetical protein